ncbi:MAG TPA: type II CAAX endopeptidase family protein [Cyclobacteriaceae bacterium]|nr:type II CAAX endopeptidase family protein [Cyclobacteriaceae bacterium]
MKTKLILLHLYPGLLILAFYLLVALFVVSHGFPGMIALLAAELLILVPIGIVHLRNWTSPFNSRPRILWIPVGFVACLVLYAPMFSVGLWARTNLFAWLPSWFYDPGFDWASKQALIITFSLGIVIDGVVGPVVEELYFRGYLLPQMKGSLAPLVNAALFTVYHFWQPHNYAAIFMVSLVLSYAAWWTKSVWASVGIHCMVNIVGSATGLFAAIGGVRPY